MKLLIAHNAVTADAPPERADVLEQACSIAAVAATMGHEVALCEWPDDPNAARRSLAQAAPDAIVNLVEEVKGVEADAHLAATILEEYGVPFTGCGARALRLTARKLTVKTMLASNDLPAPSWRDAAGRGNAHAPGVFILKPDAAHGSTGLDEEHVFTAPDDEALGERLAAFAEERFAEEYLPGREFAVALLEKDDEPESLAPAEIVFVGATRIVGYAAKWLAESAACADTPRRLSFPAEDGPLLDEAVSLAKRCWRVFGLSGYARIDLRCDASGRPRVLDVNANPCLSADAGYFASSTASGLSPALVLERLLAAAHRRAESRHA